MSEKKESSAWGKDPSGPLHDPQKEEFAKLIAAGASQKGAASELGIHYNTAATWFHHPRMKERLVDLRGGGGKFVPISVAWVAEQLKQNVLKAREAEDFNASNQALKLLRDMLVDQTKSKDTGRNLPAALPALEDGKRREVLQDRLGAQPAPIVATVVGDDAD